MRLFDVLVHRAVARLCTGLIVFDKGFGPKPPI